MDKNVVGWFEIPVTDMARAKKFYMAVFQRDLQDLPMEGMEMAAFPWVEGAPNSAGALIRQDGMVPSQEGCMLYFTCEDASDELSRVEEAGGKVLMPKTSIGEYGNVAYFLDTEGNKIGLHSRG